MAAPIQLTGHRNFRLRLVLATLAGRRVKILKIRSDDLNPGLRDHEVLFLRLLESVTNGLVIKILYTGTAVEYAPGILVNGTVTHACPPTKPVGYFVEAMLYLAPFGKEKLLVVFTGTTALESDAGLDALKWGMLPVLERFGVRDCALHTIKRGLPPDGGGEVHLQVDTRLTSPLTLHATERVKVSAIRGVAWCTRVLPLIANRMVEAARAVLRGVGVEVNITADVWRGDSAGKLPGFGCTLVGETSKGGWRYVAEGLGKAGETPEEVGTAVAHRLLEEIAIGGVCGRVQLPLVLAYMAVGKEDVGRVLVGKQQVDERLVHVLRDLKTVVGTEAVFKDEGDDMVVMVRGAGLTNSNRRVA